MKLIKSTKNACELKLVIYPNNCLMNSSVAFEGSDPFEIAICGDVVNRSLELLDVNSDEGKPIKCIKFPYTYYGSDKSEMALLFNNSPEKIQFVAILEEDAVGQESVLFLFYKRFNKENIDRVHTSL